MEKKSSAIVQLVLVALLIAAAFFVGSLTSKVDSLEKKANDSGTAENTGETGTVFDAKVLAQQVGADANAVQSCIDNKDTSKRVDSEEAGGVKAGIQGTPGVIFYDTQSKKYAVIPGAVPLESLQKAYDDLIAGKTTEAVNLDPLNDSDYVRGSRTARVVMFEYSDYDCPFCKRLQPTMKQFFEANQDKVAWVYRQYPLIQLHPTATVKSLAATCIGKVAGNDAFWAASDVLLTE